MKYKEAGLVAPTYALGCGVMALRAKILGYDIKVKGRENIPQEGPVLIGPSHRHKEDPWLMGFMAGGRVVFCMSKEELWTAQYAYLGYLIGLVGGFPVNRENPGHSTIRRAKEHLKKKRAVGIFVEGSRYEDEERKIVRGPKLGYIHRSIGRLSILENAPIIAMGIGLAIRKSGQRPSKVARIVIPPALYPKSSLSKEKAEEEIMSKFGISLQAAFTEASEAAATEASFD